jgi:hypothetical protein
MNASNDNILIPIARDFDTQKAMSEATKLAKPSQTTIHLVSSIRPGNPFSLFRPASAFERILNNDLDSYLKALLNLMYWKKFIEVNSPGVAVRVHLKAGLSWRSGIMRTVHKVGSGTIILVERPAIYWRTVVNRIFIRILTQGTDCKILSPGGHTTFMTIEKSGLILRTFFLKI